MIEKMRLSSRLAILCLVLVSMVALSHAASLELPERPAGAKGASALFAEITSLTLAQREQRILDEITSGNVPTYLRELKPVTVAACLQGTTRTATYFVTPDYMALGSESDFCRMPMTPVLAQRVADRLGCSLPTRKMADDIWKGAETKLDPQPIPPSSLMSTVPVFYDHQRMVEEQRRAAGARLGSLTAGIKKDVVITPLLVSKPLKVAICGWHKPDGTAIQPLTTVHHNGYADYSHGIRLVSKTMSVDGQTTSLQAVLADPVLSALLSDEGALSSPRYQTEQQVGVTQPK